MVNCCVVRIMSMKWCAWQRERNLLFQSVPLERVPFLTFQMKYLFQQDQWNIHSHVSCLWETSVTQMLHSASQFTSMFINDICLPHILSIDTCYGAGYMSETCQKQCFTMCEVSADWYQLDMILIWSVQQHIVWSLMDDWTGGAENLLLPKPATLGLHLVTHIT